MLFKKELCLTTSIRAQEEIRRVLGQNNIEYDVDVLDHSVQNPSMRLSNRSVVYQIFVHKKDLVAAKHLISGIRLNG